MTPKLSLFPPLYVGVMIVEGVPPFYAFLTGLTLLFTLTLWKGLTHAH